MMDTNKPDDRLTGKGGCEKHVEENSYRTCEAEFPDDMNAVADRERALLEII